MNPLPTVCLERMTALLGLALFLTAFMPSSLLAQEKEYKNGVRLGFHSAQLVEEGENLFPDNRTGFFVGYFREEKIVPLLRFTAGLEYFENGSKRDDDNNVRISYLSLPLSLKVKLGPVHAYGGGSALLRVGLTEKLNGVEAENANSRFRRMDGAAFIGAGAKILFVGLDVRYHWGLANVFENYSNRYLQIGANVYFGR